MSYTAPTFANGGAPALSAANLNPLANEVARLSAAGTAGTVNVKDYGATGDGITDDSVAIRTAAATGKTLFFPAGNYKCSPNIDTASPRAVGASRGDVTITLGAGAYLFDSNQTWADTHIQGITFSGGAGALRNRYTSSNVTNTHTVIDCNFTGYTGAAISHNAPDMPLWRIERCLFNGANQTTTIGIALAGLTDTNVIQACEFQSNYIHIKLGQGGNNAYVVHNDFVQYGAPVAGLKRTMIWVVPAVSSVNAGGGAVFSDNKFGNENLGVDDLRVAYADEGTGTYFGDRRPNYAADSTGFITGHTIRGGLVNGTGTSGNPVVYSTTPNVRGCSVADVTFGGSLPSYIFQLRTYTGQTDPEAAGNIAGPFRTADQNYSPLTIASQGGLFRAHDPNQVLDSNPATAMSMRGGGNSASYVKLLQQRIGGFTTQPGTTLAGITDALGGTDAAEVTMAGGSVYGYVPASSVVAGAPVWIEFDLKAGSTSPLTELYVQMGYDSAPSGGGGQYFRRRVKPSATWQPYRFLTQSVESSNSILLKFQPAGGSTGSLVQLGRVRMYHAREPLPTDLALPDAATTTTAPAAGGGGALPATPAGYVTVYINGAPRKLPYY